MEKDKLKQHIESNRSDFEIYEFDQNALWNELESSFQKEQKTVQVPLRYIWRAAASIVLLVGITAYLLINQFYYGSDVVAFNRFSQDLAEAHEYYGNMIDTKILQINNSAYKVDPYIFEDIEALDIAFRELKEDLRDNADNEEVINAMIHNYQLKLEILEKILEEMQEEGSDYLDRGTMN